MAAIGTPPCPLANNVDPPADVPREMRLTKSRATPIPKGIYLFPFESRKLRLMRSQPQSCDRGNGRAQPRFPSLIPGHNHKTQ
eukprot:1879786-Rhodomonas_salina.1